MNTGQLAEDMAVKHLVKQGLKLEARNVRYPFGELDLVMRDGRYWVFVEVKFRTPSGFGNAIEALSCAQQGRLRRAASHYLQCHHIDAPCRFDVVAISGNQLTWLKDAF
ncbi:YraN family protein [Shewanella sp.]|uniref:YraN family protein n=1 Tax=Shewanella sp. TaxID=50422 RepID=UPI003566C884